MWNMIVITLVMYFVLKSVFFGAAQLFGRGRETQTQKTVTLTVQRVHLAKLSDSDVSDLAPYIEYVTEHNTSHYKDVPEDLANRIKQTVEQYNLTMQQQGNKRHINLSILS